MRPRPPELGSGITWAPPTAVVVHFGSPAGSSYPSPIVTPKGAK